MRLFDGTERVTESCPHNVVFSMIRAVVDQASMSIINSTAFQAAEDYDVQNCVLEQHVLNTILTRTIYVFSLCLFIAICVKAELEMFFGTSQNETCEPEPKKSISWSKHQEGKWITTNYGRLTIPAESLYGPVWGTEEKSKPVPGIYDLGCVKCLPK